MNAKSKKRLFFLCFIAGITLSFDSFAEVTGMSKLLTTLMSGALIATSGALIFPSAPALGLMIVGAAVLMNIDTTPLTNLIKYVLSDKLDEDKGNEVLYHVAEVLDPYIERYQQDKNNLASDLNGIFKTMERNAQVVETERSGQRVRPIIYTWADVSPRNSTQEDIDPGADLDSQGRTLAYFLKPATAPQRILIGSHPSYLNVTLPKFDENGNELTAGTILSSYTQDLKADGGFFWSESSNMIYVGEDRCLELSDGSAWGTVDLKPCRRDYPKQMWKRIVQKNSATNNAPVQVAFESLAYGRCIGETAPGSTLQTLYGYECKSNGVLNANVIISYESEKRLQPFDTTTFQYNLVSDEFDAQYTSFPCMQNLVSSLNTVTSTSWKQNHSQACDVSTPILRTPRALGSKTVQAVIDKTGVDNNGNALDNVVIAPTQRRHFFGTPYLPPLMPAQWRSYVINIGQGSFSIVDGYNWKNPVIIDMGSSSGVGMSGSLIKHGQELLKFMNWLLQSDPANPRRPILIMSHADRDHYNLIRFMFDTNDSCCKKLPLPKAIYIGGTLNNLATNSNSGTATHQTEMSEWFSWVASITGSDQIEFHDKLIFKDEKLFAHDNYGVNQQIDAAIPLARPKSSTAIQVIDNKMSNRTQPWLYFLESDPSPGKNERDKNHNSLVVAIADANFSLTLPGDAIGKNEDEAVKRAAAFGLIGINGMLLSSHHGANTQHSNQDSFFKALQPSSVVFSAGNRNTFRHPTLEVYTRIRGSSIPLCLGVDLIGRKKSNADCVNAGSLKGYAGNEDREFKAGTSAIFLTDYIDFRKTASGTFSRQDMSIGGDIVVTITQANQTISRYYSSKNELDLDVGEITKVPTIEYYFTNHKTSKAKKELEIPTDSKLRDEVGLLFNAKPDGNAGNVQVK